MKKTNDKISDLKINKKFEKIKEEKYFMIRDFFEKKLNYYNQSNEKYCKIIDNYIDLYMDGINQLIMIYNKLFDSLLKISEEENCKKFEIDSNIELLNLKFNEGFKNELNRIRILKMMKACKAESNNYNAIIYEIRDKQRKYYYSLESVFNEIFKLNFSYVIIFDNSFFGRLRRNIIVIFAGRKKFEKFLKEYKEIILKDFEVRVKNHIKEIKKNINQINVLVEGEEKRIKNEYYRMII